MRTLRAGALAFALVGFSQIALAAQTDLISQRLPQTTADGPSQDGAVSGDGHFIAFTSKAYDLVTGDTNARYDIFVRDLSSGSVERVSVDSAETQSNSDSGQPAISADGRYVAFDSTASNLVSNDTNSSSDVFVRDRQTGTTKRVSLNSTGVEGTGNSYKPALSPDGRYVVFYSDAPNLISGDSNGRYDTFVHDRQLGTTERVSVGPASTQATSDSYSGAISADGRYVAFYSNASNLVAGDGNRNYDVFVRDRQGGTTERVSVDSAGLQGNSYSQRPVISSDGRFVAFYSLASNLVPSDSNATPDVFVRDRQLSTTERISVNSAAAQGSGSSYDPAISADGRYVSFWSTSSNFVTDDSNGAADVFVRDRQSGTTARASLSSAGVQGNSDSYGYGISADGRYVAVYSGASNFVSGDLNGVTDAFVRDRQNATLTLLSGSAVPSAAAGSSFLNTSLGLNPRAISADGRYVAFKSGARNLIPGGSDGNTGIFVRDRQTGSTQRADVDSAGVATTDGSQSDWGAISANGRYVAFLSESSKLVPGDTGTTVDVFVRDLQNGTTERVSVDSAGTQANSYSDKPAISGDGRYVAFVTGAPLVAGDTNSTPDIFVRDRQNGITSRVSVGAGGLQSNSASDDPTISPDGRYVAFTSYASNLVAGDSNATSDVFIRDLQTGVTERASVSSAGVQGNSTSTASSISPDLRYVTFYSYASNLVADDTNGLPDVFLRDRQTGTTERVSVDSAGVQGNQASYVSTVSADGRYVAFNSLATNLVTGGSNATGNVFVRDRLLGTTELVSVDSAGFPGNEESLQAAMTADGRYVAFTSFASNLSALDLNNSPDVFVRDRGATTSGPLFTLTPTSTNFGTVAPNTQSAPQAFTVRNTGTTSFSVTSVALAGTNPGQFSLTQNCGSLAVNATCTVNVIFKPTSTGAKSALLRVKSGATTKESTLSGTGGVASSFTLTPASVAFGNQLKNASSAAKIVTLKNTGAAGLSISSISLSGAQAAQFSQTSTCGTSLAAGASCQINVVFTPAGTGARSASLTVNAGTAKSVALTGTGVNPSFTLTPATLAFANQIRNTSSAARIVTLTNTTPGTLSITSRTIGGTNASQFSQTSTCSTTLAQGASCTISVVFRPTSAGAKSATLTVLGGSGAGSHSVALSGRGT